MTCVMRIPAAFLCTALMATPLAAAPISPADREVLLEKLAKLQTNAESVVDARFRLAVEAYQAAMTSDENAHQLYLRCLEKVEFTDEKRKKKDFRDFKRKDADKDKKQNADPNEGDEKAGFRRALRHQLRWLILTLRASSSGADRKTLLPLAQQCVSDLFDDAKMLEGQEQVLKTPVTATVFAKAYEIEKLGVDDWPLSPVNLMEIYDQLLLPPYRNSKNLDALRNGWLKRIQQEGAIREHWAKFARKLERDRAHFEQTYQVQNDGANSEVNETKIGTLESMRPPEFLKFLEVDLPQLLWEMEIDLYKAGDQHDASVRLLDHIEKYVSHPSAREWSEQFKALLRPEFAPALPKPGEPAR